MPEAQGVLYSMVAVLNIKFVINCYRKIRLCVDVSFTHMPNRFLHSVDQTVTGPSILESPSTD